MRSSARGPSCPAIVSALSGSRPRKRTRASEKDIWLAGAISAHARSNSSTYSSDISRDTGGLFSRSSSSMRMRRSKRASLSSALRPITPKPLFHHGDALLEFVLLFKLARHFHCAKAHVLNLRSDSGDSPVDLPRQSVGVE